MLLAQHILTIAVLHLLKFSKLITFPSIELQKCKEVFSIRPLSVLMTLAPSSITSLFSKCSSCIICFKKNQHSNVWVSDSLLPSNFISTSQRVLKRVTTLFVLAAESYILNKPSSTQLKQSVVVIVAGAVVAGAGTRHSNVMAVDYLENFRVNEFIQNSQHKLLNRI
jgi:hypothetical protein